MHFSNRMTVFKIYSCVEQLPNFRMVGEDPRICGALIESNQENMVIQIRILKSVMNRLLNAGFYNRHCSHGFMDPNENTNPNNRNKFIFISFNKNLIERFSSLLMPFAYLLDIS